MLTIFTEKFQVITDNADSSDSEDLENNDDSFASTVSFNINTDMKEKNTKVTNSDVNE